MQVGYVALLGQRELARHSTRGDAQLFQGQAQPQVNAAKYGASYRAAWRVI